MKKLSLIAALVASAFAAQAAVLDITLDDVFSVDLEGDADNVVLDFNLGGPAQVIGIGWDVELFADAPSWLSEMVVGFQNSASVAQVYLQPSGVDAPGTEAYSSGGIVDLVGLDLDFELADGILLLEFFEGFNDYEDDWDGIWNGTIQVEYEVVPEPATMTALALGLGLVARRRRK